MAEPVVVQCPNCDTQLRIKNPALIGKKAPCPKCGERFVLQAADAPPEDDFDFSGSNDDFGEPDDDYEEPVRKTKSSGSGKSSKGKKKRRKSSFEWKTPLLMGGGGLAALAVVAGLIYGVMTLAKGFGISTGSPPDMAWLPNDTQALMQVRVADAIASPVLKKLLDDPMLSQSMNQATQRLGVGLADVERITVAIDNIGSLGPAAGLSSRPFTVTTLRNPVNNEALLQAFSGAGGGVETLDHAGRQFSKNGDTALCVIDGKTVLLGSEQRLRAALDTGGTCQAATKFQWVDGSQHLTYAALVPAGGMPGGGPFGPAPMPSNIEGMALTVQFTSDLAARLRIQGKSVADAATGAADIRKGLDAASTQFAQMRNAPQGAGNPMLSMMFGGNEARMMDHIESALNSASVSSSGTICETKITVPGAVIDDLKPLIAMSGGGFPGGASAFGAGMPQTMPSGSPGYTPPAFPGAPGAPGAMPPGFPGTPGAPGAVPPGFPGPAGFPGAPQPIPASPPNGQQ